MKFLIAEKLSSHKFKTPEGYLVCVDSVLSRTGKQTYKKNEVFADSNDETEIEVDRKESEVFSNEALASFENKPITIEHPNEDVNTSNHNELAVGFVRDIHRGKIGNNDVMLGTLVITDQDAINMVESGELTDLSCGYDCDIVDDNGYQQTNIRGNHVALCEQGRAGIAHIVDSVDDAVPTTIEQIQKAIEDEIQTINLYDDMIEHLDLTAEQLDRIKEIRDDENDHLVHLSNMLQTITEEKIEVKDSMKDARLVGSSQTKNEYDMKDVIKQLGLNVKFIESKTLLFGGRGEYYFTIEGSRDDLEKIVKALHLRSSQYGIKDCDEIDDCNELNDACTEDAIHRYDVCYEKDGDIHVLIAARNEQDAIRKFRNQYGMYRINHVRQIDSVKDKLVDPSASAIEQFESELRYQHVNIVARGRTISGKRHYQVDYSGSPEQLDRVLDKISKQMRMMDIPMTYAVSSNSRDYSTAGIDLDKQYAHDSKISKALDAIKFIKLMKK